MNFFEEQILTHRLKKLWFPKETEFGGWEDALGVWDGNGIKLDCDDHSTTVNVIKFIEQKEKKKSPQRSQYKEDQKQTNKQKQK